MEALSESWKTTFAIIGIFTLIMAVIFALAMAGVFLQEKIIKHIKDRKFAYQQQHRFDKPPTAKCYCCDCENFEKKEYVNHCWQAEPRTRKQAEKEASDVT